MNLRDVGKLMNFKRAFNQFDWVAGFLHAQCYSGNTIYHLTKYQLSTEEGLWLF